MTKGVTPKERKLNLLKKMVLSCDFQKKKARYTLKYNGLLQFGGCRRQININTVRHIKINDSGEYIGRMKRRGISMGKMQSVQFLNDFRISVELDNGSSFIYDMKAKLSTMRFASLSDPALFKSGRLDGPDCIRWSKSLTLYSHEMLDGMKR